MIWTHDTRKHFLSPPTIYVISSIMESAHLAVSADMLTNVSAVRNLGMKLEIVTNLNTLNLMLMSPNLLRISELPTKDNG